MQYIQQLCTQIVNPPKMKYTQFDLGHCILANGRRHDFQVRNNQDQNLKCSIYLPNQPQPELVSLVYLHSMNGSRLQCLSYIENILAMGIFVTIFDFRGCGNSDNSPISFGVNQKYDIQCVVAQICQMGIRKIILWGRSMGAVACIKYLEMRQLSNTSASHKLIDICGAILDSPFSNLKQLILQLGKNKYQVPGILVSAGFHIIKGKMQQKGKFKISELDLVSTLAHTISDIPILFMASKSDVTISYKHSEKLYDAYNSIDKRLIYFQGLHNQSRDEKYTTTIQLFLYDLLAKCRVLKPQKSYKKIDLWKKEMLMKKNQRQNWQCSCSIFQRNKIQKK